MPSPTIVSGILVVVIFGSVVAFLLWQSRRRAAARVRKILKDAMEQAQRDAENKVKLGVYGDAEVKRANARETYDQLLARRNAGMRLHIPGDDLANVYQFKPKRETVVVYPRAEDTVAWPLIIPVPIASQPVDTSPSEINPTSGGHAHVDNNAGAFGGGGASASWDSSPSTSHDSGSSYSGGSCDSVSSSSSSGGSDSCGGGGVD